MECVILHSLITINVSKGHIMYPIDPISLMSLHRSTHGELVQAAQATRVTQVARSGRFTASIEAARTAGETLLRKARTALTVQSQTDVCCATA